MKSRIVLVTFLSAALASGRPSLSAAGAPPSGPRAAVVVAGSSIAIYIDGAAFHRGCRLRRDRYIRSRLQEGELKWKVFALRAADLARGEELVQEIRAAI